MKAHAPVWEEAPGKAGEEAPPVAAYPSTALSQAWPLSLTDAWAPPRGYRSCPVQAWARWVLGRFFKKVTFLCLHGLREREAGRLGHSQ